MKFVYVAYDRQGERHADALEAASEQAARDRLAELELFVAEIHEQTARKESVGRWRPGASRVRNLSEFTRQVSVLVATGTPVVQALGAVERQLSDPRFAQVVGDVRRRVEEGSALSEAMAQHPRDFDAVARSLTAAGEASGHLDVMLQRLAALARQQDIIRRGVLGALVYPTLLLTIAISVLVVMLMFVVPRFAGLFESLDTPVPGSTLTLLAASEHLRAWWWAEIPGVICAIGWMAWWITTAGGRRTLDTVMVRGPVLGRMARSLAMARIARLLGVLLESKVPLLDSLRLTREAMSNHHYARLLEHVETIVTQGDPMSTVFAQSGLVTASFAEAVRNGEQSGSVGRVLVSMAEYLDEDNGVLIKSATQIIEPIILIVLGLVVGFVAISMFLPLFDATAATGPRGGGAA